ncbi:hypothetical protein FLAVO9R_70367 [Flavobacterium sp. 9R]|nr:hypothetical protein FLAVO9R_70367 [Flavobacterium sp. 9R]
MRSLRNPLRSLRLNLNANAICGFFKPKTSMPLFALYGSNHFRFQSKTLLTYMF